MNQEKNKKVIFIVIGVLIVVGVVAWVVIKNNKKEEVVPQTITGTTDEAARSYIEVTTAKEYTPIDDPAVQYLNQMTSAPANSRVDDAERQRFIDATSGN